MAAAKSTIFLISVLIGVLALFSLANVSHAAEAIVASPDGSIVVSLKDDGGLAGYAVAYRGEMVVSDSRLGLLFKDRSGFDRDLKLAESSTSSSDTTWEQPWGERRVVRDRHHEIAVRFETAGDNPKSMTVRVRVFDDGVGFRYEIPKLAGPKAIEIVNELTEFRLPEDATYWWIPGRRWNRYEYLYRRSTADGIDVAHTPMTLKTKSGAHLSIHEAALVDYSAMALNQQRPGVFKADLAPWSDGVLVRKSGAFSTPWRTIQIAPNAASLLNSSLILNLNEPNALGDVSWVEIGKYVGVWWEMHIKKSSWGMKPLHGATTENAKRYIDFAAKNGFKGVLVEGWNIGWDDDWFGNGKVFDFTKPYPDFDLKEITDYAQSKGVRLIGHHETGGAATHYESQMDAGFALYQSLGVRVVKTGYVADGALVQRVGEDGVTNYEWHDGQFMANHHLKVVNAAARHKIAIDPHEPIKDTGLRRTYPNWVSREGARGQEYNAWGVPPNPPEHDTILPFTRMLSGPMDFTPGIFDLEPNKHPPINDALGKNDVRSRVETTLAKQLALYVTVYSPIQMAADLPYNYEKRPDAFQFIKDVPTDWEETVGVNGEIGDYVTIARKDRRSEDWYVGAVTDEKARKLAIKLDFLNDGRTYLATIYRDGDKADWKTNPEALVIERREMRKGDTLKIRLAAGGGAAIRFAPISTGAIKELGALASSFVEPRRIAVWLPPGYDDSTDRYPVIYMHDGQNLFDKSTTSYGAEWGIDEAMSHLVATGKARAAIIVGIWSTPKRFLEYMPAKAAPDIIKIGVAGAPDYARANLLSDKYLAFLVEELKPHIDRSFRTLTGPSDTFIMGSSLGGLISAYAVGEYPEVFGAAACISTHWPIAAGAAIDYFAAHLPKAGAHRFYFDFGTRTLDEPYEPYQRRMDEAMIALGYVERQDFLSRKFEGAEHSERSWSERAHIPLQFLLGDGAAPGRN